ncbi:hypothetical protein [Acinetobacter sp.]|uniref:hypothetical protein n=1 Tax=Acinetobacter sp. TaxID=472 RepID=UPI003CFFCD78
MGSKALSSLLNIPEKVELAKIPVDYKSMLIHRFSNSNSIGDLFPYLPMIFKIEDIKGEINRANIAKDDNSFIYELMDILANSFTNLISKTHWMEEPIHFKTKSGYDRPYYIGIYKNGFAFNTHHPSTGRAKPIYKSFLRYSGSIPTTYEITKILFYTHKDEISAWLKSLNNRNKAAYNMHKLFCEKLEPIIKKAESNSLDDDNDKSDQTVKELIVDLPYHKNINLFKDKTESRISKIIVDRSGMIFLDIKDKDDETYRMPLSIKRLTIIYSIRDYLKPIFDVMEDIMNSTHKTYVTDTDINAVKDELTFITTASDL